MSVGYCFCKTTLSFSVAARSAPSIGAGPRRRSAAPVRGAGPRRRAWVLQVGAAFLTRKRARVHNYWKAICFILFVVLIILIVTI